MWLSLWYIRGDRGDRNAENEGHRIPGRPGCGRHGLYCLEGMRRNARSEVKHHLLGPRLGRRVGNDAARRYTAYVGLVSARPQAASGCGKRSRHTLFTFGEVRQEANCREGVVFPTEGRRAVVRLCIANVMEMILTRNTAGLFCLWAEFRFPIGPNPGKQGNSPVIAAHCGAPQAAAFSASREGRGPGLRQHTTRLPAGFSPRL